MLKGHNVREREKPSPFQGEVAFAKQMTDEGAVRLSPLIERTACPPRPLIRPLRGHLPPAGWKAFPAGDGGIFTV